MLSGRYTIDASVFLNAFHPAELGHEDSVRLLDRLRDAVAPIVVPTIVLPEVAAAVARVQNDPHLARGLAAALGQIPHLRLIPVDVTLAQQAVAVAAAHRLRGSDAVYGAVALRFGTTLVSRDSEQRERLAAVLPTRTPAEALAEM